MAFGILFKQFRKRSLLTQTELAHQLQVRHAYIAMLESGKTKPPTCEFCEACVPVLNLDIDEKKQLMAEALLGRIVGTKSDIPFFEVLGLPTFAEQIPPIKTWPKETLIKPESATKGSLLSLTCPEEFPHFNLQKGDVLLLDPEQCGPKSGHLSLIAHPQGAQFIEGKAKASQTVLGRITRVTRKL